MRRNQIRVWTIAMGAFVAGCSTTPAPVAEIAAAKAAVERAEQPAARHAPDELLSAQRKLTAAQSALRSEDYDRARRLADEAAMDARLAMAISESSQARLSLEQVKEGITTLKQELQRKDR